MTDYRLQAETGKILISPLGFALRAEEFLDASNSLSTRGSNPSPVADFLTCRAIEGALKAYLLARGRSVADVRRLGHDLKSLLTDAFALGLDLSCALSIAQRREIIAVNDDYVGNRLAYFDVPFTVAPTSRAPDSHLLRSAAVELLSKLTPLCRNVAIGDGEPLRTPPAASDDG